MSKRSYVICHMMQTIDGKIASGQKDTEILMDYFDLYTQFKKRFKSKAFMLGRATAEAFAIKEDPTFIENKDQFAPENYTSSHASSHFCIVVDVNGKLRWEKNYVNFSNLSENLHLVVATTNKTPSSYLSYLKQKEISYVNSGESEINFPNLLETLLTEFGIEKIVVEGGGLLNGSMLKAGVIDEISLLLLPRTLNKTAAPSLFDSTSDIISTTDFKIKEFEQISNVLWINYQKVI